MSINFKTKLFMSNPKRATFATTKQQISEYTHVSCGQNLMRDSFTKNLVSFKGEKNNQPFSTTAPLPVDVEMLQKYGQEFLEQITKNTSAKNANTQYNIYRDNFISLLGDSSYNYATLRHQFNNLPFVDIDYKNCAELLNGAKCLVEATNSIAQAHQALYDADSLGGKVSARQCFDLAMKNIEHLKKDCEIELGDLSVLDKAVHPESNKTYLIIYNLLENALKYSRPGGKIKISAEMIPTTAVICGKKYKGVPARYFVIEDEGIGIKPKDKERILENGERGSNVGKIKGTGFGLDMVRRFSPGLVVIESPLYPNEPKYKGTRIKVKLPHDQNKYND